MLLDPVANKATDIVQLLLGLRRVCPLRQMQNEIYQTVDGTGSVTVSRKQKWPGVASSSPLRGEVLTVLDGVYAVIAERISK